MSQSFLGWLNSLPFPLTITHYHLFNAAVPKEAFKEGKLDSPESWDLLREREPMFSIAPSREEWLEVSELKTRKDGQDSLLKDRAEDIASLVTKHNITSIFSIGSGGAGLEYQLTKLMPTVPIVCSDYGPTTVELLRKVFIEAEEVIEFDLLAYDWSFLTLRPDAASTLCLMYRLDAQLSDSEWKKVFRTAAEQGVHNILYIPTGFLNFHDLVFRLRNRLAWRMSGKNAVFSGYLRTQTTFRSFWQRYFKASEHVLGGMTGFWLNRIK